MSLVHTYETVGQCDLYFKNDHHFSFFLQLPLLEASNVTQVCLCTRPKHGQSTINVNPWKGKFRDILKVSKTIIRFTIRNEQ